MHAYPKKHCTSEYAPNETYYPTITPNFNKSKEH